MKSTNPRYITNLTKDLTLIYMEDKSGLPELTDMSLWFKNNIKDLSKVTKIEEFPNDKRKVFDNTIYASSLNGLFSDCKLFSKQLILLYPKSISNILVIKMHLLIHSLVWKLSLN